VTSVCRGACSEAFPSRQEAEFNEAAVTDDLTAQPRSWQQQAASSRWFFLQTMTAGRALARSQRPARRSC
jgi:hypothetical protein